MRVIRINTTSDVMVNQYREISKYPDGDPFILADDKTNNRYGPFIRHTACSGSPCSQCPIHQDQVFRNDITHICYLIGCFHGGASVIHFNDVVEGI